MTARGRGLPATAGERGGGAATGRVEPGVAVRRLAVEALVRIHEEGAYANIVVPAMLERSELDERDRALVTHLVYDTTRRRRSLDWLVDRHVLTPPDPTTRAVLRLGAEQLHFTAIPAHAAVNATVAAAPKRTRGFVNAVLRKLSREAAGGKAPAAAAAPDPGGAETGSEGGPGGAVRQAPGRAAPDITWPDIATRLSYPDWILARLVEDLGETDAHAALEAMNEAATVHRREDGYTQDLASQWVVDAVGARPGEVVADLCAAPGGKATGIAATGAKVVAGDIRASRVGLVSANVAKLGLGERVSVLQADAQAPPLRQGSFDRVLVDAPCSGLGVLARRPDARWRVAEDDVAALAALQRRIVDAAVPLLRPGGTFVYSACTMTTAETEGLDAHLGEVAPHLEPAAPVAGAPWRQRGRGHQLLPQDDGTDGMYLLVLRST